MLSATGANVKQREGNLEEHVPDASGLEGDGRRPSHRRRAVKNTAEGNAMKDYGQRETVARASSSPKSAAFSSPSSAEADSHCQYGPSFLVYERSTGRFLEFFCGNKSSRIEAKKLFPFLPLTQADIDAKAAAGNEVGDLKPHGPVPVTLKTKLAENRKGTWHVPVVVMCSTPFSRLPSEEVIVREITRFLTIKDNGIEKVQDSKPAR